MPAGQESSAATLRRWVGEAGRAVALTLANTIVLGVDTANNEWQQGQKISVSTNYEMFKPWDKDKL